MPRVSPLKHFKKFALASDKRQPHTLPLEAHMLSYIRTHKCAQLNPARLLITHPFCWFNLLGQKTSQWSHKPF